MSTNKPMRSLLPAIALCAVLQPAFAGASVPVHAAGATAAPVVMHAALASTAGTPDEAAIGGTPVVVASFKGEAGARAAAPSKTAPAEENRPTTLAILFTALFVMSGIVLRRWGTGQS